VSATDKSWEIYERMIARLFADQSTPGLCVTPNAQIKGKISRRSRQIDVLLEARHDTDNTRRIIVDAKRRKRKLDVTDVEALLGLMQDANATHGYLVAPAGYTAAAEKRAQKAVSIRIIPIDRLANFDPSTWPRCRASRCKHGRIFWDGYPEMSLRGFAAGNPSKLKTMHFLHYVGKCDRCGLFYVWCTTCDDILSVPHDNEDDHGHQCKCRLPWFWLGSIEEDEQSAKSAELHAVLGNGTVITVNRRGL
jgi:hypothetical protein